MTQATEAITPLEAGSLAGLFLQRLRRSPDGLAYRQYDHAKNAWVDSTWSEVATEVGRWQQALLKEGLEPGDRVGIILRNCREWVVFDQACAGLRLITVPMYTDDRAENIAYIVREAGVKLLVVEGRLQWRKLLEVRDKLHGLQRIISVNTIEAEDKPDDERLDSLSDWLFGLKGELQTHEEAPDDLATIVYTSGTTGKPKGVMLSHRNILFNAHASSRCADLNERDLFLSFLPLSHTLERTAGYYMPMMVGAQVAYARSIQTLADDLATVKPTVLISVPRIYERVYGRINAGLKQKSPLARKLFQTTVDVGWHRFEHRQGRAGWHPKHLLWPVLNRLVAGKVLARLGGRLRYAVCGGAPLPPPIARFFVGLGLPVFHGYGMTESSPVVSVNRPDDNIPASIGTPLPGVEVKIGDKDELLTRSPSVMLGYWKNEEATHAAIDEDGWLHSGDKARMDETGHLYITGRIKEIIVLGNGEKVPPADMEMAIALDPLFDQVMVFGEGRPHLSALAVLNPDEWQALARELDVDPDSEEDLNSRFVEKTLRARISHQLREFTGFAQVRRVIPLLEPWTVEDGLLTPTLKMKRNRILDQYADRIEALYENYSE
ncbi:long-chain fatty acid--CoA ligase [Thioalkalivibrio denitrificans]|uniref:Long-chain fatty acid--CoA ligase n=1 Tax=Thioalkalivibrio denitrificans TaxID=108003 RepID=A0A1V3NUG6_9GAMM|nr:long-chain fatty acid--CoA ligase [Thioalkalivibrio denitrificans]OOG28767.1 long-chain fatty acid--CoA ligase [Thioalkalivibrio denitrificans]